LLTNFSYKKALPPYVQTFIAIKEPKKIFKTNKDILKNNFPFIKPLEKFIPIIPNIQIVAAKLAEGPIIIIDTKYYRGLLSLALILKDMFLNKEGIYLEYNNELSKMDEDALIIKNRNETLGFLSKKRNLLIISPTLKALLAAKANIYMEDKEDISIKPRGDIFSFFMPHNLIKDLISFYPQLEFLLPITQQIDYGTISLFFEEEFIKLELDIISKNPQTYKQKVYEKLLSLEMGSSNLSDFIPARSEAFVSLSLNDFQNLYRYLVVILKDYPDLFDRLVMATGVAKRLSEQEFEDLFFSWIGQNIGSVILNDEPVFIVEVKDKDKFLKVFTNFIGEKKVVNNIEITAIELPGIIGILKSLFAPSIKMPFFTIFKDYLLISNSPEQIIKFIKMSDVPIVTQKEYQRSIADLKKGQVEFYLDLGYGNHPFLGNDRFLEIVKKYQKTYGTLNMDYPNIKFEIIFHKTN